MMHHGGDIYRNQVHMDYSVNLNPLGTPADVLSAVREALGRADAYPDLRQEKVREELAATVGGSAESVICGNGASELLMGVARTVMPKKALLFDPCFTGYTHVLDAVGCEVCHHALHEENGFCLTMQDLDALRPGIDMVILSDPVNPTGQALEDGLLDELLMKAKGLGIAVVLDESFLLMSDKAEKGRDNSIELVSRYNGLWIIRSMTKVLAMPGIRMGYAVSGGENIEALRKQLPEWNLSVTAEAAMRAGIRALSDNAYMDRLLRLLREERGYLVASLRELGFTVYESRTAFLLFRGPKGLYGELLKQGILIRDCSDISGLGEGYYRIAVRGHEENVALIRALGGCKDEA